MASRFWPDGDAVGARINIDDNNDGPRPVEIVGVVGNVKHLSLESAPTFDVYLPLGQVHEDGVGLITNTLYWVVRSRLDAHEIESVFRQALRDVDREAATSNITTLEELRGRFSWTAQVQPASVDDFLRCRATAGRNRHLWARVLYCKPADAGNRYPHGVGCEEEKDLSDDYRSWIKVGA